MQIANYEPCTVLNARRSPAFTLATTLVWSGHECRSRQTPDERVRVWPINLSPEATPTGLRTLLDLEFGAAWSLEENANLIRRVNDCTSRDRIQVRERIPTGQLALSVMDSLLFDLASEGFS